MHLQRCVKEYSTNLLSVYEITNKIEIIYNFCKNISFNFYTQKYIYPETIIPTKSKLLISHRNILEIIPDNLFRTKLFHRLGSIGSKCFVWLTCWLYLHFRFRNTLQYCAESTWNWRSGCIMLDCVCYRETL